jgi:hypothetical protein
MPDQQKSGHGHYHHVACQWAKHSLIDGAALRPGQIVCPRGSDEETEKKAADTAAHPGSRKPGRHQLLHAATEHEIADVAEGGFEEQTDLESAITRR